MLSKIHTVRCSLFFLAVPLETFGREGGPGVEEICSKPSVILLLLLFFFSFHLYDVPSEVETTVLCPALIGWYLGFDFGVLTCRIMPISSHEPVNY